MLGNIIRSCGTAGSMKACIHVLFQTPFSAFKKKSHGSIVPYILYISAFNHVNKSVDGYSMPVIYDNTPPTVGKLEVNGGGMKRFVTTNNILLEWSDIDDDESGIRKIEIGIGSSNGSADIVQFEEFVNYAEINSNDRFQDGREYFGILRVII